LQAGWVVAKATRDIGLAVIELGGGRRRASDTIDHRVGFADIVSLGRRVERGDALATVHAAQADHAEFAVRRLQACIHVGDVPPDPLPLIIARVAAPSTSTGPP
jgi:thymidine phosphorylase